MPLTVHDVQKIEKTRKEIKKEIYKKIYDQLSKKLKSAVELCQKQVILRVPSYMLGYPAYDLQKAGDYIQRQFERGGFIVHRMSTVDIYVSWNIKQNKKSGAKPPTSAPSLEDDTSLPTLINLKKLASKYKNA